MISMARKIPQATALMKAGKWDKKKFMGTELTSKVLGIVGLGNIGKILADRARGLKMIAIAYDPFLTAEVAEKIGVEKVELPELYKRADFISVHTPLTDQTKGLVGKAAFDQMKKGVRIINAARGGIVDEAALLEALESGKVGGAALDVFVEEPPPANHPLIMHERVICTPHLGASTDEAQVKVAIEIAEQFGDFFQSGQIRNSVNVPALSADLLKQLQPYFELGEKLGSLLGQLHQETIQEIDCRFEGEIASYDVKPISTAIVRGILAPALDLSVNYVNAPSIAKDRGIKLVTSKSNESTDFTNLVTVTVRSSGKSLSVSGTILGKAAPRITKFDDHFLEASLKGTILVLRNLDKPGVVGALGTTLGKNGVNIARMQLGLKPGGTEAVSFINIDSPAPQAVLDEISKLPNMISVRQVKL
jgi:D-3-phosphoglycerate dehydrogenase / 2-oxoglutarate reductase